MKSQSRGISAIRSWTYRRTFIEHVHVLVWRAYSQLDRSTLSVMDEPEISGLICEAIQVTLDDPNAPDWVDDYEIHDDPPVHDKSRKGKRRRRVDIKLASRRQRPRTRFCFEAKCLNKNAGVTDYLGKEGLGQFISGAYAASECDSGMLAYVQKDDCATWSGKIAAKVDTNKHKLGRGGTWRSILISELIEHCYQTIHNRPRSLKNITVLHTFLDCT
ncbi:MAG: hypothetical protein ABJZ55_17895 [Fuerstiella sp.]